MSNMEVIVSLAFDVSFPVDAKDEAEAEQIAEEMKLTDFMEWATCSSYDMNVLEVRKE